MYQLHHAAIRQTEMKSRQMEKYTATWFRSVIFVNTEHRIIIKYYFERYPKRASVRIVLKHVWDSSCELILMLLLSILLFADTIRMSCLNVILFEFFFFFYLFLFGLFSIQTRIPFPFVHYKRDRNYNTITKTFLEAFLFCSLFFPFK